MNKTTIINNYLKALNITQLNTLEDITKLIQAHTITFAFSSMKVLLADKISLNLESIYDSLVVNRRGGYCFEHNKLMYEALKESGFDVKFYLARVVNNQEGDEPQTHRFTLLTYEGKDYIIDVGIGFRSPTAPIPFSKEVATTNLDIKYWVESFNDGMYGLMSQESNQPFRITKFDMKYCNEGDFEMGHFYSHQHPCAVFVNNLVLSTITNEQTNSLRNSRYLKISPLGVKEIKIEDAKHFYSILKSDFNCNFSSKEALTIYENYVKV